MSEYRRPPKTRPTFPKRAVITGGMPYGNKSLHFGHIGGVFIHADVFTRFMRDRIGSENVIFVSGTDCYGSPIVEHHRKISTEGYQKSLVDFVTENHNHQVETLAKYQVSPNLFAASGLGRAGEIHTKISQEIFETLLKNGHLEKLETRQFYDSTHKVYLNGRQVIGRCPIDGCRSEKAYADECDLGHQYQPHELINPVSTLSQTTPEMRNIVNWYLDLPKFLGTLQEWIEQANALPGSRRPAIASIREFFGPPVIHTVKKQIDALEAIRTSLPPHGFEDNSKKSVTLKFSTLEDREKACDILSANGIQYRTGKTLVPFRLSGNIDWGVPVPVHDELDNLTFWVWPESLWAPISFTATYLESLGKGQDSWKDWWCSPDAQVYQFIGEDNVYFYGPAEMALFMGMQGSKFSAHPEAGQLQLPELIVNRHLLFLNTKASSSGKIKPPMADELLEHYSPAQLRSHFISLGLGSKNISFQPKPYNPKAPENAPDPVEKEGKLLTNIFNRVIWKIVETLHTDYNSQLPVGLPSKDLQTITDEAIMDYEIAMHTKQFHRALKTADGYLRTLNKKWSATLRNQSDLSEEERTQALVDAVHMLRFSLLLMHPITPKACDRIRVILGLSHQLWNWDRIHDPIETLKMDTYSVVANIGKEENFFE